MADRQKLVYDWNQIGDPEPLTRKRVLLDDETLRDGLQSPTVSDPPIEDKIHLLHLMEDLGIQMLDIGLPGAGPRAYADSLALAPEIARSGLRSVRIAPREPRFRTSNPFSTSRRKTGVVIDAATFLGSSMIRQYVENWTMDDLLRRTEEAVAVRRYAGRPVMYVTEDTTRAFPGNDQKALHNGNQLRRTAHRADRHCRSCHTGWRQSAGAIRDREVVEPSGEEILISWHGHNDRGLSVMNSLAAVQAGADVIHGCALGSANVSETRRWTRCWSI